VKTQGSRTKYPKSLLRPVLVFKLLNAIQQLRTRSLLLPRAIETTINLTSQCPFDFETILCRQNPRLGSHVSLCLTSEPAVGLAGKFFMGQLPRHVLKKKGWNGFQSYQQQPFHVGLQVIFVHISVISGTIGEQSCTQPPRCTLPHYLESSNDLLIPHPIIFNT
jgi:hypothetical protein